MSLISPKHNPWPIARPRGGYRYSKHTKFCHFRENKKISFNMITQTRIHVFLQILVRIGEWKWRKQCVVYLRKTKLWIFSATRGDRWRNPSNSSTVALFSDPLSIWKVSSKLIYFPWQYVQKCNKFITILAQSTGFMKTTTFHTSTRVVIIAV